MWLERFFLALVLVVQAQAGEHSRKRGDVGQALPLVLERSLSAAAALIFPTLYYFEMSVQQPSRPPRIR